MTLPRGPRLLLFYHSEITLQAQQVCDYLSVHIVYTMGCGSSRAVADVADENQSLSPAPVARVSETSCPVSCAVNSEVTLVSASIPFFLVRRVMLLHSSVCTQIVLVLVCIFRPTGFDFLYRWYHSLGFFSFVPGVIGSGQRGEDVRV